MKVLDRRGFRLVAGLAGASALLFALYRLWKHLTPPHQPPQPKQETHSSEEEEVSSDEEEHVPFDELIEDRHRERMGSGRVVELRELKEINYRAIFCLLKGSSYQGIVCISFQLGQLTDTPFALNFNGAGLKFLMVNGQRIDSRDIQFLDHTIRIPRELLRERSKNSIEVIFENNYSFLNEGLCAYFTIDENQKYSLRQQVIYSNNGYLEVERMLPCINCLNPCTVRVEVIHPDTFEVFSNASKSLERFCSVTEYHKYPFLFELSSNSLNRSFKMNASTVSGGDTSSQYSSSNFYNRKKANTHFYPAKLPSIHSLFVFSSAIAELFPDPVDDPMQETLLLRYFCKHSESHRFSRTLNKLHAFILDALKRLAGEGHNPIGKLDVLITADRESEGNFAPGVIMLSEKSLSESLSLRCLYLVGRAVAGVWQLSRGENTVTLEQVLGLNELVFKRFEQFRNYMCLKNLKHERIRSLVLSVGQKEYLAANEGFFLKYYAKQLKFILLRNSITNVSSDFGSLMHALKRNAPSDFWQSLLVNQGHLPPLLLEPLIKLAQRRIGAPSDEKLREQLKVNFNASRFVLGFYSDQEVSDNLPKFMEYEAEGLEQRLPQLKVKQKFKDFITERYEKFLPVKSNMAEAEAIYNQFKKFNQVKNFHPHELLKKEVSRVVAFGSGFVRPERISAQCSVAGWKLLRKLKLYPADEDYFAFLNKVDDLQQL